MKNPTELLKECNENMTDQNVSEVIAGVYEIITYFNKNDIASHTGDDLSRAALKLSVLLVNLGQEVARASLFANASYIYRKFRRAGKVSKLSKSADSKMSFSKAEKVVDEDLSEEFEGELKSQHYADSIKTLYEDAERLVSVIQSRLRILTNEEIRSKIN